MVHIKKHVKSFLSFLKKSKKSVHVISICSICWKQRNYIECENCHNHDYGKCYDCGEQKIKRNWCSNCKPLEIIPTFTLWTSGNDKIDQLIQEDQLIPKYHDWDCWRWIEYNELNDIEYKSKGGFGEVYKAQWNNIPIEYSKYGYSNEVAMKKLMNSQNISKDFIKEINAHLKNKYFFIVKIFGITRDPSTEEYAIIMRYCNKGDWKGIIRNKNRSLLWKDRLKMLYKVTIALSNFHDNGYMHCDIHPGNILLNNYTTYLSDLGLCKPADYKSPSGEIYGIIPYMAPEVLRGKSFIPASDVYSFGMIMWELTSREAPFNNLPHDQYLILSICDGLRPQIIKGTPEVYGDLMRSCWEKDPSNRPTSEELCIIIGEWYNASFNKINNPEYYEIFKRADKEMAKLESTQQHPDSYNVSRPLSKYIIAARAISEDSEDSRDTRDDLEIIEVDSLEITIDEEISLEITIDEEIRF
ncbi:hypothetical protein Glove_103g234 [Diversispora epigaea]|uniref:Protein kinase domain-containing protein n=1 Tax=Diversispora epigaea TaxID=1348612 RepID=A0A397J601_9GLOM|nr:hypothetical protein Glove_103g234 [Diversispora epigaea]